jgi:hypothetical protein
VRPFWSLKAVASASKGGRRRHRPHEAGGGFVGG